MVGRTSIQSGGDMTGKSRRGFASMDPTRQREIASKGGRAAHEKGTAHEWSSDEARQAGRKGGVTVSRDRAHMAAIGREGGESRSAAARQARLSRMNEREIPMPVARDANSEQRTVPAERPHSDGPRVDDASAR
jgi:general stress protein YciG